MSLSTSEMSIDDMARYHGEILTAKEWFKNNINLKEYDKFEIVYSDPFTFPRYITPAISCYMKSEGFSVKEMTSDEVLSSDDWICEDIIIILVDARSFYGTIQEVQKHLKNMRCLLRGVIFIPTITGNLINRILGGILFSFINPEVLYIHVNKKEELKRLLSEDHSDNQVIKDICDFMECVVRAGYNVTTLGFDHKDYIEEKQWIYLMSIEYTRRNNKSILLVDMDEDVNEALEVLKLPEIDESVFIIAYYRDIGFQRDYIEAVVEDVAGTYVFNRAFSELPPVKILRGRGEL